MRQREEIQELLRTDGVSSPPDWGNYAISHAHNWQKVEPAPWMDAREIATLEKLLTSDARVLEFGAGGSTLWLAARTREVHSVEHDQEWVNKIAVMLPKNVTVHCRQPAFAHRHHEPAKPGQFNEYISVPEQLGVMFDVCLVDGRARIECALAAAQWLKPRGWLVFHDWFPRSRYTSRLAELAPFYELREDLSVRDTSQTLAVFERNDVR